MMFADFNNSKLGFKQQFVKDAIARKAGASTIPLGTESDYEQSFLQGLLDGEKVAGFT